jgi:hypothetical protein
MSSHLTPLQVCEALIGSLETIGEAAGVHPKTPYGWRQRSVNRAAGDIPVPRMRNLLAYAAAREIPLEERQLIWGATPGDIAALKRAPVGVPEADLSAQVAAQCPVFRPPPHSQGRNAARRSSPRGPAAAVPRQRIPRRVRRRLVP